MSSIREKGDEMVVSIRKIKFSGDYDKFYECKEKTREISGHTVILKYLTKEWGINKKEGA